MAQNEKITYTTMQANVLAELIKEKLKTADKVVIKNVMIPSRMKHGEKFINPYENCPSYSIYVNEFDRDESKHTLKHKTVEFKNCKLCDAEFVFASYSNYNKLSIVYIDCEVQHFDVLIGSGERVITFINCKVQNCFYNDAVNYGMFRTRIEAFYNTVFEYCVFTHCDAACFIHYAGEKFVNCKFKDCDFTCADLSKSTFNDCKCDMSTTGFMLTCPEKGEYTAYKKARIYVYNKNGKNAISDMMNGKYKYDAHAENVIVELRIPKDAKRSSATTRKCRASKAKVISITSIDGKKHYKKAVAGFNSNFFYEVGKIVVPTNGYEENRWIECAAGIHHFITRDEAVDYSL